MFAIDGSSVEVGHSIGLSATPNVWVGDSVIQRVSAMKSWYKEAQASAVRLKNKPVVLSPNSVVYGFSPTGSGSAGAVVAVGSGAIGAVSADDEAHLVRDIDVDGVSVAGTCCMDLATRRQPRKAKCLGCSSLLALLFRSGL